MKRYYQLTHICQDCPDSRTIVCLLEMLDLKSNRIAQLYICLYIKQTSENVRTCDTNARDNYNLIVQRETIKPSAPLKIFKILGRRSCSSRDALTFVASREWFCFIVNFCNDLALIFRVFCCDQNYSPDGQARFLLIELHARWSNCIDKKTEENFYIYF